MSRTGAILLYPATLAFIASSVTFVLRPGSAPSPVPYNEMVELLSPQPFYQHEALRRNLSEMFLDPQDAGMLGLLVMVWAALTHHALRQLFEPRHIGGSGEAGAGTDDAPAPLIAGLVLGAVWPWLAPLYPLPAFILSSAMLAGFLAAAQKGVRTGPRIERSSSLGFVAGWALLVCLSAFAVMVQDRLGVPQSIAAAVAILIGTAATVGVQLQLGKRIGFSVAVIWGLIGIAAGTVASDATIATATVLAISVIAVALVRVTT